jgi:integrase
VPLHATTTIALREYARVRDRHWPTPSTPAFFITTSGARLTASAFRTAFVRVIKRVGLEGRGQRLRPRPHDLRHAFAVHTLVGWYRSGEDVNRKLPLLSTYLGHVDPASTYWYLEAVPELLELLSQRLQILPEVLS